MSEEHKPFWSKIFTGHQSSESEEKVLGYIVHRCNEGANLHEVVEDEYVKRNATRSQIDDILRDPRLIHSAHERMTEAFRSGELDPKGRPEH